MKASIDIAHSDSQYADVNLWYGNVIDLSPGFIEEMYNY